jgi:predicted ribosomally synthesized peptide with SipW-like signal peptide
MAVPARRLLPVRIDRSAVAAPPIRLPAAVPVRVAAPGLVRVGGATRTVRFGLGQQVLLTLMLLGVLVGIVGSGTFASFNSLTKNSATITSGVLVLGDKLNAGTECFSAGGATVTAANTTACSGVWNITTQLPGVAITPLDMTIRNAGNIAASKLEIYPSATCADSTNGTGYNGGGSLCGQIQLQIQQYTDNTFTTPKTSSCLYGTASGTTPFACVADATKTLGNFGSTVSSGSPINTGALSAGGSDYFQIVAILPGTSGDGFQGRRADLTFTWELFQ